MATAEEHAILYGQLRAQLLARHFAFGKYFRANHVSLWNRLGSTHRQGSGTSVDQDDKAVGCTNREAARPSAYGDAAGLLAATGTVAGEVERWRVHDHGRENPLMLGSQLFVALAIEHSLGRTGALPVLQAAIHALGSLYKFHGRHMDGYIIRWDPVTSDRWMTADQAGVIDPLYCCEFPLGADRQYRYCTPFNHPQYVPFDPTEFYAEDPEQPGHWRTYTTNDDWPPRRRSLERFRSWEPSMDELVGLVLTYAAVHELVPEPTLRQEISRQVANLADYLGEHGYLLVRPDGGFSARGASGALPSLEYPFSRVFTRITGRSFPSRSSFEGAMEKAGVWRTLEPALRAWTVGGLVVGGGLGALAGGIVSLFSDSAAAKGFGALIGGALGARAGWTIARALGLLANGNVFDVWRIDQRQEFALAYLFKELPVSVQGRFELFMRGVAMGWGRHARGFPPFLGLTALFDSTDSAVRNAYLSLNPGAETDSRGEVLNSGFAIAVGVALGARRLEATLRDWLDQAYDRFTSDSCRRHLSLQDSWGLVRETIRNGSGGEGGNDPMDALEYLVCLALSWHVVRLQREAGLPESQITLFDLPSSIQSWPTPTAPNVAVQAGLVPGLVSTASEDGAIETHLPSRGDVPLFPSDDSPPPAEAYKPPDPPPTLPPVVAVQEVDFSVRERDGVVEPGIFVQENDTVRVTAGGEIWAGVWLTGRNGPEGWNRIENNASFPLPGSRPFALLYKVVENGADASSVRWRWMGPSLELAAWAPARMLFRINDDRPGNGSGQFDCHARIERAQP